MKTTLYPPIKPYNTGHLPVSNLHSIYFEESGNPKGIPVIHFHGGPGSASKPEYRQYFNPQKYRIILFDQRGSGQSTPVGEIKDNTTQDLVADTEKLRRHFKINRWLVYGGSWGSTLGLVYAQTHPQSVLGLILRGIFLGRTQDAEWLTNSGANHFYPDLWARYEAYFAKHNIPIKDSTSFLYHQLTSGSRAEQIDATITIENWEPNLLRLNQKIVINTKKDITDKEIASDRIFIHYEVNHSFLKPNQILKNVFKIKHLPKTIIQGRYDMIAPPNQAWELHQALPDSKLMIVPAAGHHHSEPGIQKALIQATDEFALS